MMKMIFVGLCFLGFQVSAETVFENPDVQSPAEIEAARVAVEQDFANATQPSALSLFETQRILWQYRFVDVALDVPQDLLQKALVFFEANKAKFANPNYITIVNFKERSDRARLFVINMIDGTVEKFHTTHGIGSDRKNTGTPYVFGNVLNSGMSSVGFVRTGEVYQGKFKRSVRLDGLSTTNSNMRARAVVFHGWDGVKEADVIQKRSWGCITLDWTVRDGVIDKIKEGSLLYADVAE